MKASFTAVRGDVNTCDLRGLRVDESIHRVAIFLDQMLRSDHKVVFILHGHGTGALKQAIRRWLPTCSYVAQWRPADETEGGDAFTMVLLR